MQITRSSLQTAKGPQEWFTGDVYIDTVAAPAGPSRAGAAMVHLAMQEADDTGSPVAWGAPVTAEEYGRQPG